MVGSDIIVRISLCVPNSLCSICYLVDTTLSLCANVL